MPPKGIHQLIQHASTPLPRYAPDVIKKGGRDVSLAHHCSDEKGWAAHLAYCAVRLVLSTSLFQLKLSLLVTPTSRWEVQVRDIWGPDGEPVKVKKVLAAAAAASEADTLR